VKVLMVHPGPHFAVADVYNGLKAGLLANGATVGEVKLDERLDAFSQFTIKRGRKHHKAFSDEGAVMAASQAIEVALYRQWPDVVILMSGFFIPPELYAVMAMRPHHTVLWCTESPYEDDRQARPARYVDTVILNDPTNLELFRSINPRTYYLPHSYDPAVHHPGPASADLACDFGFVGTGFQSRIDFFEQVDWSGVDTRIGGHWKGLEDGSPLMPFLLHDIAHCMDNARAAELYRSAKVCANLYRKEHTEEAHADGWAMGPREVELAACGAFFLRESRPEGDDLFPMLPIFDSPDDFGDQLRWWLARPDRREIAATAARAAIADRTFTNTAATLLRLVDGAGKKQLAVA
jgi:spore maturation protein CgeB